MQGPDVTWYLVVSALLFSIGTLGVLLRRSPLIVLLSLEIMLNAANLALISFSRLHGDTDGQIFALAVMAVAASEVVIGLGLIVAVARRKLVLDVDRFRALRG
ncbi:MAG: NADH-quinone oxidoreductase subunit NuoK [Actinobacteria bacterium]|nr:NADH-quinone oxidoreductase subunit NuoK [Actinomycetota bacterium]